MGNEEKACKILKYKLKTENEGGAGKCCCFRLCPRDDFWMDRGKKSGRYVVQGSQEAKSTTMQGERKKRRHQ